MSSICTVYTRPKSLETVLVEITFCNKTRHFPPQFWKQGEEAYFVRWNFLINTRGWPCCINHPSWWGYYSNVSHYGPWGRWGSLGFWKDTYGNARMGVWLLKSLLSKTESLSYMVQKILPGGPCSYPLCPLLAMSQVTCIGMWPYTHFKWGIHLEEHGQPLPGLGINQPQTPPKHAFIHSKLMHTCLKGS